jgi:hypothetical protein
LLTLRKDKPALVQVYQTWYIALHPMKLNASHSPEPYQQLFPDLRSKPRAEQKRMLNEMIQRRRLDHVVMSDPRTDVRPLVLDWA